MSLGVIVVPCHDEERRLRPAEFRRFAAAHDEVRFLLVNDGSRDGTLSLLDELRSSDPRRFDVLNLAQNQGKAEAVRCGVLQAAQRQPDFIGYWDADLATPLETIDQFVSVLLRRPEINLVLGARVQLLGHTIRRRRLRGWLGRRFAQAASLALGVQFCDTQCGAKMFRATPQMLAAFSQPFRSRWIFDVELLARLIQLRRTTMQPSVREIVYELPLDQWEDVAGSKLKGRDFTRAVGQLGSIWWHYLRPAAPALETATVMVPALENPAPNEQRRAA